MTPLQSPATGRAPRADSRTTAGEAVSASYLVHPGASARATPPVGAENGWSRGPAHAADAADGVLELDPSVASGPLRRRAHGIGLVQYLSALTHLAVASQDEHSPAADPRPSKRHPPGPRRRRRTTDVGPETSAVGPSRPDRASALPGPRQWDRRRPPSPRAHDAAAHPSSRLRPRRRPDPRSARLRGGASGVALRTRRFGARADAAGPSQGKTTRPIRPP